LAKFIFCENKTADDSCGHCPNCGKINRLEHADLHLSFPTIPPNPKKTAMSLYFIKEFREFITQHPYGTTYDWLQYINADNKQGNITADECRKIIDTLNLKSYEGGKKILIMWRPEYLKKEGNILLKMIEEPPADTLIFLVAESLEDILPTIRSRTQAVKLAPLPAADIAARLVATSMASPVNAAQLAHLAQGSYAEAIKLSNHVDNDLFPAVRDLFNHIFTKNGVGITKFAEEWAKAGREQQKNLLHYIIQLMEQAIRARYSPTMPLSLPEPEAKFVRSLAGTKTTFDAFGEMISAITDTIFYVERNANSKIQLHALALRMQHFVQGRPLPVL
ncbi:MAG: hypothetical protein H7257_14845, partial [Taibaiella sp.]|nr:hypothetical protein [Taibaiella sp.]